MKVFVLAEKQPKPLPEMSDEQTRIYVTLRDKKGSYLKTHRSFSGADGYRLMGAGHSPISNYTAAQVNGMIDKEILQRVEI